MSRVHSVPSSEPITKWSTAAYFASLIAVWGAVSYRLSFFWETSDQYSHGWFVPLLAGSVFWGRWASRPQPRALRPVWRALAVVALALLVVPFVAANLVLESSPDWRMMTYLLSGSAFFASLLLTELAGGASWRRHFTFVFFFFLVAVPWPYDFEKWLTVGLSMLGANITAGTLSLVGIPAVCHGTTVDLAGGVLGVEEACSGIRSFQSSLMASLLLGEWYQLRPLWRIGLCGLGLFVAYALNIARMLLLGVVVEFSGPSSIEKWHDPAGFAILVLTLGALWLVCIALAGPVREENRGAAADTPRRPNPTLLYAAPAVLVVLLLMFAGTEFWFRSKERGRVADLSWGLVEGVGGRDQPLSEGIVRGLACDVGMTRAWADLSGRHWDLIFLRWNPGRKAATAGPHAPDYCQKALGRTVVEKSGRRIAKVGSIEIPYQIYTVQNGAQRFYLMFVIDDGRRGADWLEAGLMGENSSRARRVNRLVEGVRNTGQSSLQLALAGVDDEKTAEQEMLAMLPQLIETKQRGTANGRKAD